MGFMDKLKAVKNMVTGGGADVFLDINGPALEETFTVTIRAKIGPAEVKPSRIYLKIKSVEEVTVRNIEVAEEWNDEIRRERRDVTQSSNLFDTEINVADGASLEADQTYTWETEVRLPDSVLPTFIGRNASHRWYFQGALDVRGNDPDSGWVEAEIY